MSGLYARESDFAICNGFRLRARIFFAFGLKLAEGTSITPPIRTSASSDIEQDWFLTNEQMAEARKKINDEAASRRVFCHMIFTPGQPGWLLNVSKGRDRLSRNRFGRSAPRPLAPPGGAFPCSPVSCRRRNIRSAPRVIASRWTA